MPVRANECQGKARDLQKDWCWAGCLTGDRGWGDRGSVDFMWLGLVWVVGWAVRLGWVGLSRSLGCFRGLGRTLVVWLMIRIYAFSKCCHASSLGENGGCFASQCTLPSLGRTGWLIGLVTEPGPKLLGCFVGLVG
jgi:hypothetical protein